MPGSLSYSTILLDDTCTVYTQIFSVNLFVLSQSDSLKKRGSVKAEMSLSAVELSGKVIKRGYLLKQVNTALLRC